MKTLLIGNTEYVSEEFIRNAFPGDSVVLIGNPNLKSDKNHQIISHGFTMEDERTDQMLLGYHFDKIVYFSNFLTWNGEQLGELERIQRIFHNYQISPETRMIYLTAHESGYPKTSGKKEVARVSVSVFNHYCKSMGVSVKIVRIPFLYSASYREDFLYKALKAIDEKRKVVLNVAPEDYTFFLSPKDLSALLFKLFERWDNKSEVLEYADKMQLQYSELEKAVRKAVGRNVTVEYTGKTTAIPIAETNTSLEDRYGWAQGISIARQFPELYQDYQRKNHPKVRSSRKVLNWMKKHQRLILLLELVLGFLCTELVSKAVSSSIRFRSVDFRLMYVVVMGSMYGINTGIIASLLAGAALAGAFVSNGLSLISLFYDPSNWLPFVGYFAVGIICGYIKLKNQDEIALVKNENKLLQSKILSLEQLYSEALENQRSYKKQIFSSRDSFAKALEITQRLDTLESDKVIMQALFVLEELLENRSVAIYAVDSLKRFGRLATCSFEIKGNMQNTIDLSIYADAMTSIQSGEVWTNVELQDGFPMHIAPLHGVDGAEYLVMLWNSSFEQNEIYYINKVKILCGMIESSLVRAMKYQKLIESTKDK